MELSLRSATLEDAELLYKWRNDPKVREVSRDQKEFDFASHLSWLETGLANKHRGLFIAQIEEKPVGVVRYDLQDGWYELSWTVAPEMRGQGIGKQMVGLLVKRISGPICAEIKSGNIASIHIAEALGMNLESTKEGIMRYSKGAIK